MKILDILNSPRIRSLEDIIVGYMEYTSFSDVIDELGIAKMRKHLIDKKLVENCKEELREDILYFDKLLKKEVKKIEKKCKETWKDIVNDDVFLGEKDLDVRGKISLGCEYPTLHPLQDDDRQSLWDMLVDESFSNNHAYVEAYNSTNNYYNKIRRKRQEPDPLWKEYMEISPEDEFIESLNLSGSFFILYKNSFLAITDLIYVRTFETEIKIIEEPNIGSPYITI